MWVGVCVCMWGLLHTDVYACVHTRTNVYACVHVCAHVWVCGVNHGAGADVRGWVGAVRLTVGGCVFGCWWLWLAGLSWVRVNGAGKMRPPRYVCVCTWAHVCSCGHTCTCTPMCACARLGAGAMCVCSDGSCAWLGPVRVIGWGRVRCACARMGPSLG